MMAMMPMMPAAPMHFGGHLPGIILDRCRSARVNQRQRLSALGWRGQHQQCANGGKP
jgi:hypothetical protein